MTPEDIQQIGEIILKSNNSFYNTISKSLISNSSADHDLLVIVNNEVKNIRNDIKNMEDGTTKRVEKLEVEKADSCIVEALQKKVNEDFEGRVRELEKFKAEMNGKASQGALIISYIIAIIGIGLSLIGMFK